MVAHRRKELHDLQPMTLVSEQHHSPCLHWRDAQGNSHVLRVEDRVFLGRVCAGAPLGKRMVIDDVNVSRDHAVVTLRAGQLFIRDTSRNGTRVNGVRISPGVEQRLCRGDVIQIGAWQVTVECQEAAATVEHSTEAIDQTQVVAVDAMVTHLVADVRGFSTLAQSSEAQVLYAVMTRLYKELSEVIVAHHGTVKDYAGDAIFAFWEHGGEPRAELAELACRAALAQAAAVACVATELATHYPALAPVRMGWGISTGRVTVSHYGVRADNLALVGDSTNLAFRLAALADKTLASPIVVCACTAELVLPQLPLIPLGDVETKGRTGLERVFGLK